MSSTCQALTDYLSCSSSLLPPGEFDIPKKPHFLWVTEFPLFTQADEDKDFLAKGRWSSSHHPFTAPMWQDIKAMYTGEIENVRIVSALSPIPPILRFSSARLTFHFIAGTRPTLRSCAKWGRNRWRLCSCARCQYAKLHLQ